MAKKIGKAPRRWVSAMELPNAGLPRSTVSTKAAAMKERISTRGKRCYPKHNEQSAAIVYYPPSVGAHNAPLPIERSLPLDPASCPRYANLQFTCHPVPDIA